MNEEILKRIKSTYPGKDLVVHQSTPVLLFGDFNNAGVFTLGINPSNLEFADKKGKKNIVNQGKNLLIFQQMHIKSIKAKAGKVGLIF